MRVRDRGVLGPVALVLVAVVAAGCRRSSPGDGESRASSDVVLVRGTGATVPAPIFETWTTEYRSVAPNVRVGYQPLGSGAGVRQLEDRTTDFAASDVALSDADLARAPTPLVHVPVTLGAVAVTYNLAGARPLRLSAGLLAAVYLGVVRAWDDPRIAALNPDGALPATPITVVHRADGSGTSFTFTEHLSRASAPFREQIGSGLSVRFPVGLAAKGSEGVTAQVKSTPGAIGYVESSFAALSGLPVAEIENRAGRFVAPSVASVTAAATSVAAVPDDLRLSILDAPGEASYPLSAYSFALVYAEQTDEVKGPALARFLWWVIHDGQRFNAPLHHAPLPEPVVAQAERRLRALHRHGKPILASK